jgi:hypothetical protein
MSNAVSIAMPAFRPISGTAQLVAFEISLARQDIVGMPRGGTVTLDTTRVIQRGDRTEVDWNDQLRTSLIWLGEAFVISSIGAAITIYGLVRLTGWGSVVRRISWAYFNHSRSVLQNSLRLRQRRLVRSWIDVMRGSPFRTI